MSGGEELVDEERPRNQDEEESVAKLGLRIHSHRVTVETNLETLREVVHADGTPIVRFPDAVIISVARFNFIIIA